MVNCLNYRLLQSEYMAVDEGAKKGKWRQCNVDAPGAGRNNLMRLLGIVCGDLGKKSYLIRMLLSKNTSYNQQTESRGRNKRKIIAIR
ncbi:hypothetical protein Plhal304r1_c006g0022741 [Plasmopara halstedii]